jgi:peroxiredoxin
MRQIHILFLLLLFSSSTLHGQIHLNGLAPKHINKSAKLNRIVDFSTFRMEVIDRTKIDSLGRFSFKINPQNAFLSVIEIDNEYGYIYIDPTTLKYDFLFPDNKENVNRFRKTTNQLIFNDLPSNDLNTLILDFNLRLDYFLYGDTNSLIRMAKRNQEFRDSLNVFKEKLIPLYGAIKKEYLHNYIRYSIASIEQLTNFKDSEKSRLLNYNFYLNNMPVLYENNAYMSFFNQFYENILSIAENNNEEKIKFAINNYNSLEKLDLALANDYFLKDERIREMAIINGLSEIFNNKYYNANNILSILNEIALKSKFSEHKKISTYLIQTLTNLNRGTKAPDFKLINQFNDSILLIKGKTIYLNFFSTANTPSLLEMEIIKSLHEKYSKTITFISVSLDENKADYENYVLRYSDYKWNICHYNFNYQLIDDYKIKSLPKYILIDKTGKINQAPAYSPIPDGNNHSIDETFFSIQKSRKPNKEFNVGKKDARIGSKN